MPARAAAVLDRAIARYGGWDRWRQINRIELRVASLHGKLPRLKGHGATFPRFRQVVIEPHTGRTTFPAYLSDHSAGVYENGGVSFGSTYIVSSPQHRSTFDGLVKHRRWSPQDAVYFFGYALLHYHSLPFGLTDAAIVAVAKKTHRGQDLDVLTVDFPPAIETHSTRQTFYFDPTGLIVRHDYTADIVGRWATGAHEWLDYQDVDGFPVAMRRKVWWRIGGRPLPILVLRARFNEVVVR